MEFLSHLIDIFLHLDKHLAEVVGNYGTWTYLLLFLIIFCETGLVVTPILPGDSLLFAAGAIAATGGMDISTLVILLSVAAIIGDSVNYSIGYYLGPKVLTGNSRFLKKEYIQRTEEFYAKYGGKTIIFARFVPIVRTFAPFLAGVGRMRYQYFATYNIVGGLIWIFVFVLGGYYFGNIPIVKRNFTLVIIAIIILSVLPAMIEHRRMKRAASAN